MAYSRFGSAVDDRVETVHLGELPRLREDSDYSNGPQEGRWTVGSTARSAVDDRCPTTWRLGSEHHVSEEHSHARAIDVGLLRKLKIATDQNRREAEVKATKADVTAHEQQRETTKPAASTKEPRGFHVPRLETSRKAQTQPEAKVKNAQSEGREQQTKWQKGKKQQAPKEQAKESQAQKQQAPDPQPEAQPPKQKQKKLKGKNKEAAEPQRPDSPAIVPPSVGSKRSTTVCIVAKDGREEFMEIPHTSRKSRPPSEAKSMAVEEAARSQVAKIAAEVMMSGALPSSDKSASRHDSGAYVKPYVESLRSEKVLSVRNFSAAVERVNRNSERESLGGSVRGSFHAPVRDSAYISAQNSAHGLSARRSKASGSARENAPASIKLSAVGSAKDSALGSARLSALGLAALGGAASARSSSSAVGLGPTLDDARGSIRSSVHADEQVDRRQSAPTSVHDYAPLSGLGSARISAHEADPGGGRRSAALSVHDHSRRDAHDNPGSERRASSNRLQNHTPASARRSGSDKPGEPKTPSLHGPIPWNYVDELPWRQSVTPEHPFWESPRVESAKVSANLPLQKQDERRAPSAASARSANNGRKTIFAGKGWVTPHPLSEASSYLASPPQSRILINDGYEQAREMTHAEFEAIQEGHAEHRRSSLRSASVASRTMRLSPAASSIRQSAHHEEVEARGSDYRSQRSEARSSQRSGKVSIKASTRAGEDEALMDTGMRCSDMAVEEDAMSDTYVRLARAAEEEAVAYAAQLEAHIAIVKAAQGMPVPSEDGWS